MQTWPSTEVTEMEGNSLASHLIFTLYAKMSLDVDKALILTKSKETFSGQTKALQSDFCLRTTFRLAETFYLLLFRSKHRLEKIANDVLQINLFPQFFKTIIGALYLDMKNLKVNMIKTSPSLISIFKNIIQNF